MARSGECARLSRLNPESGATTLAVGGGYAAFLGAGSPLSQALGLGLSGPVRETEVRALEDFFRQRKTSTQIEVASLADPTLLSLLGRLGYHVAHQTHVLVHTLRSANPNGLSGSPLEAEPERGMSAEICVTKVKPSEIGTWASSVLRCFFDGPEGPPAVLLEGAVAMASIPAVSGWLVRLDDRVAGGALWWSMTDWR